MHTCTKFQKKSVGRFKRYRCAHILADIRTQTQTHGLRLGHNLFFQNWKKSKIEPKSVCLSVCVCILMSARTCAQRYLLNCRTDLLETWHKDALDTGLHFLKI